MIVVKILSVSKLDVIKVYRGRVGISLNLHRRAQRRKTCTYIHASSGSRTHGSSVRTVKDSDATGKFGELLYISNVVGLKINADTLNVSILSPHSTYIPIPSQPSAFRWRNSTSSMLCDVPNYLVASSFLGPNILLNSSFSNTCV
jgi:hypothetical protein